MKNLFYMTLGAVITIGAFYSRVKLERHTLINLDSRHDLRCQIEPTQESIREAMAYLQALQAQRQNGFKAPETL